MALAMRLTMAFSVVLPSGSFSYGVCHGMCHGEGDTPQENVTMVRTVGLRVLLPWYIFMVNLGMSISAIMCHVYAVLHGTSHGVTHRATHGVPHGTSIEYPKVYTMSPWLVPMVYPMAHFPHRACQYHGASHGTPHLVPQGTQICHG